MLRQKMQFIIIIALLRNTIQTHKNMTYQKYHLELIVAEHNSLQLENCQFKANSDILFVNIRM